MRANGAGGAACRPAIGVRGAAGPVRRAWACARRPGGGGGGGGGVAASSTCLEIDTRPTVPPSFQGRFNRSGQRKKNRPAFPPCSGERQDSGPSGRGARKGFSSTRKSSLSEVRGGPGARASEVAGRRLGSMLSRSGNAAAGRPIRAEQPKLDDIGRAGAKAVEGNRGDKVRRVHGATANVVSPGPPVWPLRSCRAGSPPSAAQPGCRSRARLWIRRCRGKAPQKKKKTARSHSFLPHFSASGRAQRRWKEEKPPPPAMFDRIVSEIRY
jgi:hypothetical protein